MPRSPTPVALPPTIEHGSVSAYTNHKCGCAKCRKGWNANQRDARARRRAALAAGEVAIQHGTPAAYREYGCKCSECTAAVLADNAD